MMTIPKIAITLGDPSGIGPEIVVKAITHPSLDKTSQKIVLGTTRQVKKALQLAGIEKDVRTLKHPNNTQETDDVIQVLECPKYEEKDFLYGKHIKESGAASHFWVERATKLCIEKSVDAMVTAPVNKISWKIAGSKDTGHLEVFKRLTSSNYVATMLLSNNLRCMHLSTHKPLADACEYVTKENVLRAIKLTYKHFIEWGFNNPKIGVAALNPHASDNGIIGNTEAEEIIPAINEAKLLKINVSGPHPADYVFNQGINGKYDVIIVMYHDQGHIPIKVFGLEKSVTVNLGLPFIRTSVDHGTAFDIAGKNTADETSMIEAIKLSISLANRQGFDGSK